MCSSVFERFVLSGLGPVKLSLCKLLIAHDLENPSTNAGKVAKSTIAPRVFIGRKHISVNSAPPGIHLVHLWDFAGHG